MPGLTVDVYANGQKLLTNFKPGTLTDPLALPAGTYDLKVFAAGNGPRRHPRDRGRRRQVPAGANITVVAHLDAAGKPVADAVRQRRLDDHGRPDPPHRPARRRGPRRRRPRRRHAGLQGPHQPERGQGRPPRRHRQRRRVLAGTTTVAIGPADLNLTEGTNTIVYAWGSATDKNLKLAVQTISGLHGNPGGVPRAPAAWSTTACRCRSPRSRSWPWAAPPSPAASSSSPGAEQQTAAPAVA